VIHFNVAHSEGLALLACTRVGGVGIDLEWIRDLPDWEQVAETAFSAHELAQLRACPPERRRDEFFRSWTRQEAVLKALGTGLANTPDDAAWSAFHVYPLDVAPGYAAAFAAAPGVHRPRPILDWQAPVPSREASAPHHRFNPTSPT
jgi:phosphopantetheinyl transferase